MLPIKYYKSDSTKLKQFQYQTSPKQIADLEICSNETEMTTNSAE